MKLLPVGLSDEDVRAVWVHLPVVGWRVQDDVVGAVAREALNDGQEDAPFRDVCPPGVEPAVLLQCAVKGRNVIRWQCVTHGLSSLL